MPHYTPKNLILTTTHIRTHTYMHACMQAGMHYLYIYIYLHHLSLSLSLSLSRSLSLRLCPLLLGVHNPKSFFTLLKVSRKQKLSSLYDLYRVILSCNMRPTSDLQTHRPKQIEYAVLRRMMLLLSSLESFLEKWVASILTRGYYGISSSRDFKNPGTDVNPTLE